MPTPFRRSRSGTALFALSALGLCALSSISASAAPVTLHGQISPAVRSGQAVGRLSGTQPLALAFTLPLRNQAGLQTLLRNLYDPKSPDYRHFLTPDEFTARFAPTQADYAKAVAYAHAQGFTVTATHPNRTLLEVSGTAVQAEHAFGLHLMTYQAPSGRRFYAPDTEPSVPLEIASVVSGIIGLDNAALRHPQLRMRPDFTTSPLDSFAQPLTTGSGPSGGLAPSDIKTAYNLNSVTQTGSGQTLGLFELDGYKASDITKYESYFSLPAVTLQNVLVSGATGSAGSGADEVTLDIELQIALAPGATKIEVYEGPNSDTGVTATYNKIATDNTAKEISTSWGEAEASNSTATLNSENTAFQQMASQGQSIFAAAGDSGADDNGSSLSVDDPASQPYMVGVGGTKLTTSSPGGPYSTETTWNNGSASAGAGGGGISTEWSIPSFQSGVVTTASKGSTTKRNVPDVSLEADPNSGYAIYYNGAWVIYGGTSCAAPLWSAFTALVNQKLAAAGSSLIGFADPSIYTVAKGSGYSSDFHDIADGSTNLYYPAVTGYDDATGWGSFNGANLLAALSGGTTSPTVPAAPTGLTATAGNAQVALSWSASSGATSYSVYKGTTSGSETLLKSGLTATTYTDTAVTNGTTYYYQVTATNSAGTSGKSNEASAKPAASGGGTPMQLLGNPGFETGTASPWTASTSVINNDVTDEPAHSGSWDAWLDGYGSTHTDTLSQTVTIPSTITTATLSFYLHVDTAETTTSTAYDKLTVQLKNSSGTVLTTLATYSNLNAASGYTLKTFDVSAYKGQAVTLLLTGKEDSSEQTSFVVDDFALNVK